LVPPSPIIGGRPGQCQLGGRATARLHDGATGQRPWGHLGPTSLSSRFSPNYPNWSNIPDATTRTRRSRPSTARRARIPAGPTNQWRRVRIGSPDGRLIRSRSSPQSSRPTPSWAGSSHTSRQLQACSAHIIDRGCPREENCVLGATLLRPPRTSLGKNIRQTLG
jgi:hypothetical protein